jgi:hypothetical protein
MTERHQGQENSRVRRVSKFAALALALTSSRVCADSFQEMWMGRVARPPADNEEASVYWEDTWVAGCWTSRSVPRARSAATDCAVSTSGAPVTNSRALRQNSPTGKSPKESMSSPSRKNISVAASGKSKV